MFEIEAEHGTIVMPIGGRTSLADGAGSVFCESFLSPSPSPYPFLSDLRTFSCSD